MVMGSATFATIGRALPGRRTIVYTRHPERITAEVVETTSESPTALIKRLEDEGSASLAICGGTQIYSLFMKAKAVDELYITISPLLFGRGLSLFDTSVDAQLELLNSSLINPQEMLLHYRVQG
jgi:dihydrofolate reductase